MDPKNWAKSVCFVSVFVVLEKIKKKRKKYYFSQTSCHFSLGKLGVGRDGKEEKEEEEELIFLFF